MYIFMYNYIILYIYTSPNRTPNLQQKPQTPPASLAPLKPVEAAAAGAGGRSETGDLSESSRGVYGNMWHSDSWNDSRLQHLSTDNGLGHAVHAVRGFNI